MDSVDVVAMPGFRHQKDRARSMARGLAAHGITARIQSGVNCATETVVCWGWRVGKALKAAGHKVLVMEAGYIGDRVHEWTSLAWDGLNGRGTFPEIDTPGRFAKWFEMEPWQISGDYVLFLGQIPGDQSLITCRNYRHVVYSTLEAIEQAGYRALWRPHPLGGYEAGPRHKILRGSLHNALSGALFTVTYNSNSAVESVLAGVPCVTLDVGSIAYEVTSHDLAPITPDREDWANRLAWKQWRQYEIESGEAWEAMQC